jgi:outer membrane protein OmpA-like peptidoglycan-associated protein
MRLGAKSLVISVTLWLTGCGATNQATPTPGGAPLAPPVSLFKETEIIPESADPNGAGFGSVAILPMALQGDIYFLEAGTGRLPDFASLEPVGRVYATSLNVPVRDFTEGFPGVTDRFEWFAIDYHGVLNVVPGGEYRFRVTSDDGSRLFVDDHLVVDNDGLHPVRPVEGRIQLQAGPHAVRVQYFQGPRTGVALVVELAEGDGSFAPLDTSKKNAAAEVARTADKMRVTLEDSILFDRDRHELKSDAKLVLERLVASQRTIQPPPRLIVEGHTDDTGTKEHNLQLSRRRAESVVQWLAAHGIERERVEARGYGEDYPRVSNDTDAHRKKNRRVEIVLLGVPPPSSTRAAK